LPTTRPKLWLLAGAMNPWQTIAIQTSHSTVPCHKHLGQRYMGHVYLNNTISVANRRLGIILNIKHMADRITPFLCRTNYSTALSLHECNHPRLEPI
jgi:hypothetical protein